ncbi:C40 family peptidase [Micromonospora sp. LZ34]
MVDSGRGRRHGRRRPVISPVLRPALWSALLGAVAAAVLASPSYAEPGLPTSVPDTGARPTYSGALRLPGGAPVPGLPGTPGAPVSNLGNGPLASAIYAAEVRVGQLGDQLLLLRQKRTDAEGQLATARRDLDLARDALARAQQGADVAAADALKAAAALPPGGFASDLHDLNRLSRITRGEKAEGGTTAADGELSRARTGEQVAYQAWLAADSRARGAQQEYASTEQALRAEEAKLLKLRKDNAAQLVEIEKQQEAAEQRLGAGYLANETVNGLAAHPMALAAVAYAKAQLGDPYLWAAEGPDRFDCSGLMWAAYRSAGYHALPRVSRDQYYATRSRTVARTALLPGDLLFFASGSSWTSIHHVGMYIGGGKMVHAPTTGDVVKISTVRWSRLYAATRVIGAVPAPTTAPTPTPSPTTTKPSTPKPTETGKPGPTQPGTTPTRPPKPTPTTPSPTPTPTGTTSPSPTGSQTSAAPSPDETTTSAPASASVSGDPEASESTASGSVSASASS